MVAPEIHVGSVGDEAGVGGEGGEVGEGSGGGKGGGWFSAGSATTGETFDLVAGDITEQGIAVAWVVSPAGDAVVGGELLAEAVAACPGAVGLFGEGDDEAGIVVAEEVFAGKLGQAVAAVDKAAGDGGAVDDGIGWEGVGGAAVVVDGRIAGPTFWRGEWGEGGGVGLETFAPGPAAVEARGDEVDFFAVVLADIGAEEASALGIEGHAPGVAEADGVEFGADGGFGEGEAVVGGIAGALGEWEEWVVGGDGVTVGSDGAVADGVGAAFVVRIGWEGAGFFIDVDAQDGAEEIFGDAAGVVGAVVLGAFVADGDVEVAVGSEGEVAAVVVAGFVALGDERGFGFFIGDGGGVEVAGGS